MNEFVEQMIEFLLRLDRIDVTALLLLLETKLYGNHIRASGLSKDYGSGSCVAAIRQQALHVRVLKLANAWRGTLEVEVLYTFQ